MFVRCYSKTTHQIGKASLRVSFKTLCVKMQAGPGRDSGICSCITLPRFRVRCVMLLIKPIYRPPEDFVYARIQTLLNRFSQREETAWLPASVRETLRKLSAAVERND